MRKGFSIKPGEQTTQISAKLPERLIEDFTIARARRKALVQEAVAEALQDWTAKALGTSTEVPTVNTVQVRSKLAEIPATGPLKRCYDLVSKIITRGNPRQIRSLEDILGAMLLAVDTNSGAQTDAAGATDRKSESKDASGGSIEESSHGGRKHGAR